MFSSKEIIDACENSEFNLSRYGFEHRSFSCGFTEGVMWAAMKINKANKHEETKSKKDLDNNKGLKI